MAFTWPVMLWALAALPLLLWAYLGVLRRQQRMRERLADTRLLAHLVTPLPPWRRHLPVGIYLVAVLLLVLAMARPIAAIPLPVNRAAVVVAIDTSKSMIAEDVKPNRLDAARGAARELIRAMPGGARIGLVAFSDYGTVLVPPSTDRQALVEALDRLQPQQATSVGSAILEALRVLPLRKEFLGDRLERLRGPVPQANPLFPSPLPAPTPTPTPGPPTAPPSVKDLPPAAILIFSDGVSNLGADPRAAAALAAEARVKIYAVGLGQQGGSVMTYQNQLVLVPFNPVLLQEVARQTGGEYFSAANLEELRRIYRQLGRAIGWERRRTELTSLAAGAAGLLMLSGGLLSMLWFRRLP
ncbi:MAG: VWA domain-containing protein [Armatimonadota bacterium]|nr:VWA domain-containing protein [Armatimonadota bacterium]MDR7427426.1 VWA domain-containing protein [Armatimonadota bacterium]MDR7539492.1 VWA domain-containing protein [Armatimonadota bacterium]